jgi:hypothetical protein
LEGSEAVQRKEYTMKELGDFEFKIISNAVEPGPNENVILRLNCEGKVPGGMVVCTVVINKPGKTGEFTVYGVNYHDNGEITTSRGSGRYESIGQHRWRVENDIITSDGRRMRTEGQTVLETRTWSGRVLLTD